MVCKYVSMYFKCRFSEVRALKPEGWEYVYHPAPDWKGSGEAPDLKVDSTPEDFNETTDLSRLQPKLLSKVRSWGLERPAAPF